MPCKTLMNALRALHHVTIRGTERNPIFQDNWDKDNFVGRLGATLLDTSKSFYARTGASVLAPITFLCN